MTIPRFLRSVLAVALTVSGLTMFADSPAQAEDVDPGLVAWYKLDEASGTQAADSSGNGRHASVTGAASWRGGDGFQFNGGASSSGNAIKLPDWLTAGLADATVDFDVNVASDLSGFWFMFNLGTEQFWPNGNGYLFVTGTDSNGKLRASIAEKGFATEQSTTAPSALPRQVWKHVTYSVKGGSSGAPGSARLYVDGQLVAENTSLTVSPAALGEPDGSTNYNWLGRSAYAADTSFKGALRDFRIYDRALTQADVDARIQSKVQDAVDAIELVDADGVRGNLALPTTGAYGAAFTWESSNTDVVSPSGIVHRPPTGSDPVSVDLTVTGVLSGGEATRTIRVTVLPTPAPLDYEAYAFAYFVGESTSNGEKIYFAASKGNDPMAWDRLNDGKPVLKSDLGEKGLRDPFILRSHEGDKFWLLATDLRIYGGNNFSEAQESGSKHLMVWESTDLVNWSEQSMVKVSSDFAGNTWAPEAFYDEASGEYVVYWASNLYPTTDVTSRDYRTSYNRMMYVTTRDFRTFSEAKPWVDVKRGDGRGMIDATVVRDGDTFYRFIKDEASFTVRQEKSTDLKAVVTGSLPTGTSSPWSLVKERVGVGQPNPWGGSFTQGEGPTVFRDNEVADRWYMLIDQPSYHGGQGYMAFVTDDIASGDWTSIPDADLPTSPRHGTVIPITQDELDRLRQHLQPSLIATSSDSVGVTTREGVAPQLPDTVPVTYADGSSRETGVTWDEVDPSEYADWGSFTVHGTLAGGQAVSATAQVTVTDGADPTVAIRTSPATPNGLAGWFTTRPTVTASAADEESGVDELELSVDGGETWSTDTSVVLGDGVHDVHARATDASGNRSAVQTLTLKVDSDAPVSRATWSSDNRSATIRAADGPSGLSRIEYQVGPDKTWLTYTGPITFGPAATTLRYRAVDVAGNVEVTNTLSIPGKNLDATHTKASFAKPSVKLGKTAELRVTVTGGPTTPTGDVEVTRNGQSVGSGALSGGKATIWIDSRPLGVGSHQLVVRYVGDASHAGSQATVTLKVDK